MNNSEKENFTTESLSRVDSFEALTGNIHLLDINEEACGDLAFDLLQCQEGVIAGMKVMGRLLQEQSHWMDRNGGAGFDEYGDAGTLNEIGEYLGGSAKLLSGLSTAITELSARSVLKK